mmetsp:Transcript_23251/g.37807  ORF Transcript_23251/g.37807 Transcript_23251/m.37807 type:complete len:190 (-) Transcript_23251:207-776(-)
MTHQREEQPKPYYLRPNAHQEQMNERMVELIPELDSEFARTPMANGEWKSPQDKLDDGTPCFIPGNSEIEKKQDYIWMPQRKDLPAGYYHLRTQEAYIQVYHLFRKRRPRRKLLSYCCRQSAKDKEEQELYKQIDMLLHNRLIAERPNDVEAARMRLLNIKAAGGRKAAFGRAAYLPTLTTVLLTNLTF